MHTSASPVPNLPPELLARLQQWAADGRRRLLGLVAPPGGGKSTLAQALVQALPDAAVAVPMDGFHLANAELARLGRAGRKGAPDTFDAHGYVALLRRLRSQPHGEVIYAPAFRREIEEPVAGAIAVDPRCPIVITEGNYLLLPDAPWDGVHGLLDECWYLDIDDAVRRERLVARHVRHGRTPDEASEWAARTDEPNARLVAGSRHRAHVTIAWP